MKKMFLIAVSVIMIAAILLVAYGTFLNYKSEYIINLRLINKVLHLEGVKVQERSMIPVWSRESLRMEAENMTDAVSRLEGTVENVYVKQNDRVVKGQPVCRIANEDIPIKLAQIDVSIAKAEAVKIRYQHSYERYKKLVEYGAISLEQYEEAETNYKAAMEEVRQLNLERRQYELQEERLLITAPFDGEVLMVYKHPGSFLTAGTSVALIGDFSSLEFSEVLTDEEVHGLGDLQKPGELQFNERDMEKIYGTAYKKGNMGAAQRFKTVISKIEPPTSIEAQMRKVTWLVDNSSGLLEAKRYQDVKIFSLNEKHCLAVPEQAMIDARRDSVYVWHPENGELELRKIVSGVTDGSYIEVVEGLKPDEIVVISGKDGLADGMKATVELRGGADNAGE